MVISKTSFEKFIQYSQLQSKRVVTLEMLGDCYTPVNVFQALAEDHPQAILLDTSDYRKHSPADAGVFIGLDPIASFMAHHHEVTVTTSAGTHHFHSEQPFQALREFYHQYHCHCDHPLAKLAGGIVGFMSHDAIRLIENIPDRHPNSDQIPDLYFTCYNSHVVFDRRTGKILLAQYCKLDDNGDMDERKSYTAAINALEALKEKIEASNDTCLTNKTKKILTTDVLPKESDFIASISTDSDDASYGEMVEQAKAYIRAGEAFQIVPSRRFQCPFYGDDFNIYRALKALNPSPYLYYIRYQDLSIIGASPEKLVSLQNGIVQITPIAGSRPRGINLEEDEKLAQELLIDGKELAEHMMLIDLARNDVGKVCEPGTVSVVESKIINKFSHIMHLTSIVEGQLRADYDVFDVLQSGFPAGTTTGAPKIRATQIIDEIEQSRRGLYGGAVCAIDNKGQLDSCILIRTAVVKNNVATVRAGAGIVLDSNPVTEAEETRNKAKGVLAAIELATKISA